MTPVRRRAAGLVLVGVVLAVVCTFLGRWQWHRHEWRDAQIATVHKTLDDAVVKAPAGGVVTSKLLHAGEMAAARAPIVVITDLDHAWANVYVDERLVPQLTIGQAVTLVTDAGQRLPGTITFISPKAEFTPRNVQTAEERSKLVYRIRISVDNRAGVLKQGMPVEAELELQPQE